MAYSSKKGKKCLNSWCLKITEKISFNIASEASYLPFIFWVDQKCIENVKNGTIWLVFEKLKFEVRQCYQSGQFWSDENETFWLVFKLCGVKIIFFCKTVACGQTVLPDRSIVIPKKLDENVILNCFLYTIWRVLEIPN